MTPYNHTTMYLIKTIHCYLCVQVATHIKYLPAQPCAVILTLPENLPVLSITAKCYLYSTHGIFIPAGGGCEDTDREGDPSGLGKRKKTSGYRSPSSVPAHEMCDSHTV